jgi:acyl-CoA synthetase (NDP forming)
MALTMSAPQDIVRSYEEKGFLVHEDGSALMCALGALARFRTSFDGATSSSVGVDERLRVSFAEASLSEREAKRILAQAGIRFPDDALVRPGDDAGVAAARIGFPVAIKICSPDIPHKTEIGGVVLIGVLKPDQIAVQTQLGDFDQKTMLRQIELWGERIIPAVNRALSGDIRGKQSAVSVC